MLDPMNTNRYPTSPLSSRPPPRTLAVSPPPGHRRGNHGRQASRSTQSNLGRYHPSNFPQADPPTAIAAATAQAPPPSIMYTRPATGTQVESPRLLRENYRVFLEKEKLSSKLAASPLAVKPDAPRLDPLGSPKGPMTPLELAEDAVDYFGVVGTGRVSPAATPGTKSPRSSSMSSYEESKPNKARKVDLYL